MVLHLLDETKLCPQNISSYIGNLTQSYTDQSNEATIVSTSVIMFVLAGLFFNLNLFSGISDVSAILDPKVRLFLSSALSLFLPVMSYLFSEAKNAAYLSTSYSSASSTHRVADLSLTAGLILTWMLLVELLRKKVDEIRMRGYSGTIHRAGRVIWLGSLVFFNIRSAGRKAVFSVLWILCATKVAQRIAFTEVAKLSYAHGRNAAVITSYMAQMLQRHRHDEHQEEPHRPAAAAADHDDVEHGPTRQQGGDALLKRCKYIVMGEKKLVKKATADGYKLNDAESSDSIITVGKVWELAEKDPLFETFDKNQRLKRLCLSFALFKLLRRRFEHLPAMNVEEARDCRKFILNGLYGENKEAEALFQVMNDEVNFLSEYYHSVIPVVFASPFFLVSNYFLLPIVVTVICLMSIVVCGNGDAAFAFTSLRADNYALRTGVSKIVMCLLAKALKNNPPAFFALVDISITVFLFLIFFYEEIWEFLVFLLSNWFMVSLLCSYTAKSHWRVSPTFSGAFRRLLWLRSKMSHTDLRVKQFSALNLRWPRHIPLFAPFSLVIRTERVPNSLKRSIMDCLVEHDRRSTPLTNGTSALDKHGFSNQPLLREACVSDSVAEVMLTWHIAPTILEVRCAPTSSSTSRKVAVKLSKYCAYLVAFHPELLPDNKQKAEDVLEEMKGELKGILGCPAYFFSSKTARVDKIMEAADENKIPVETPRQSDHHRGSQMVDDDDESSKKIVVKGAKLGKFLVEEVGGETAWKVLADVWTELVVFAAPSSEEVRVKGHEEVLVQGGEFITVLWALTTHIGVARPPSTKH
ncbi:hypothetical protein HU200_056444 [Digitaria exilis]|uniref:DUF4220 domain-containing protein n=1 Tax=Digitaria exilis TaxID=1010633 RepID=A0A835AH37_9POAL|nr:hypothetical protein HU200_056444 [Digitaria exilis]CAB3466789.1 unnamed protein product [Digitaria exilis]